MTANEEAAAAWDAEAEGWLAHAERYEHVGARHWHRFLDEVEVAPADRVVDIGCGAGSSTIEMARRATEGSAVGIDISRRMVDHARRRAAESGVPNVRFEHGDAQVHPFPRGGADLTISVFGTMFFADPVAAFTNISAALRDGGRLALLAWRELARNEWLTALRAALAVGRQLPEPPPGAPGPFSLADGAHVRSILEAGRLVEVDLVAIEEPMWFGSDAEDAYRFLESFGLTKGLTESLDEADRSRAFESLRHMVAEHETPDGVLLGSSAWLVTARAGGGR